MVKEINQEEFSNSIKVGKVLVDCYAPWCGPCKMLSPIIDNLADENLNVSFYKINIDEAEEIATQYDIMSIPTLLIFENGELKDRTTGLKSKEEIEDILG